MKIIYAVFGLLIIGGLVFFLTSCNHNSKGNRKTSTQHLLDSAKVKLTKLKYDPYPVLRNKSLSLTPEQLQLKLDASKTTAYGTIMEWDMGEVVVTVVAFQTGDASIYISTGQVFVGGITHDNIKKEALTLVKESQQYLSAAIPTSETPMPDKDCVRFYFLTNKGKYYLQETVEKIQSGNSDLTKLYILGNNLITEYRLTTQK